MHAHYTHAPTHTWPCRQWWSCAALKQTRELSVDETGTGRPSPRSAQCWVDPGAEPRRPGRAGREKRQAASPGLTPHAAASTIHTHAPLQPCRRIGWLPRALEALSIPSISPSMTTRTVAGGAPRPCSFFLPCCPRPTRESIQCSPPWGMIGEEALSLRIFFFATLVLPEVYQGLGLPDSSLDHSPVQPSISFTVLHLVCIFSLLGLTEPISQSVTHPTHTYTHSQPVARCLCSALLCISKPFLGPATSSRADSSRRTLEEVKRRQQEKNPPPAPISTSAPTQHPGTRSTHDCLRPH